MSPMLIRATRREHSVQCLSLWLSLCSGNCRIAKGPISHLLADFFIMTSQSNGPSDISAIVTSQWNDVKKPHGKPRPEIGERSITPYKATCTKDMFLYNNFDQVSDALSRKYVIRMQCILLCFGYSLWVQLANRRCQLQCTWSLVSPCAQVS